MRVVAWFIEVAHSIQRIGFSGAVLEDQFFCRTHHQLIMFTRMTRILGVINPQFLDMNM